mmetsp:Transcript_12065/g.41953  ORF Transcript_12065/g.41953 Transcript_12065/m.41953 type:complete len:207 (-) Transcript_12065:397-1017(-)
MVAVGGRGNLLPKAMCMPLWRTLPSAPPTEDPPRDLGLSDFSLLPRSMFDREALLYCNHIRILDMFKTCVQLSTAGGSSTPLGRSSATPTGAASPTSSESIEVSMRLSLTLKIRLNLQVAEIESDSRHQYSEILVTGPKLSWNKPAASMHRLIHMLLLTMSRGRRTCSGVALTSLLLQDRFILLLVFDWSRIVISTLNPFPAGTNS